MKYLPNKTRGANKFVLYIFAALALVVVFYFRHATVFSFLNRAALVISYPFWKTQDIVVTRLSKWLINFDEKEALAIKNRYLSEKINSFNYAQKEIDLLKRENLEMKKILGRIEDPSEKISGTILGKLGYILSGPVSPPYDSVVLDIGSGSGVSVGDRVVGGEGYAIGEVIETTPSSSKVRLYSAYGVKTEVFLGKNDTMMEIVGLGSGNFFIRIPKDFVVSRGDVALLPGEGFRLLAEVGSIEGKTGEMFKSAILFAPFNIRNLKTVFVVSSTAK